MVLHGYVQFAGEPINMEGNIDYAFLKAIENGANLNFILSYQNTNLLKNYETSSKNYSVRYDIWFDDLVGIYNELNSVVKDLQTSLIVDHQFIDGQRIPDDDEILADSEAALKEAIKVEDELIITSEEALRAKLLEARKGGKSGIKLLPSLIVKNADGQIRTVEDMSKIDKGDIKMIMVNKASDSKQFEKYGDISNGVVIIEVR
jgi:hypothetical protein